MLSARQQAAIFIDIVLVLYVNNLLHAGSSSFFYIVYSTALTDGRWSLWNTNSFGIHNCEMQLLRLTPQTSFVGIHGYTYHVFVTVGLDDHISD
jgi:hypothetical protein